MVQMHHADHLLTADFESSASGDGSCGSQTRPGNCCERLFAHKVACGEKRDDSFLPDRGDHRDLCAALLKIKNRVRGIALREEWAGED